ncbi:protein FAM162B-like [Narcine bancroftii]|uniref:protein FAM162B-like n=1 Tax=Narcine bancroftii TaxID=1343680 RepID=UPI003831CE14
MSRRLGAAVAIRATSGFGAGHGPRVRAGRWASGNVEEGASSRAVTEREGTRTFKLPGHKPSTVDKKFLVWTGRFRQEEDIPAQVSIETIHAARNKMRVKGGYFMIIVTIIGCIATIISGKKAARRQESLSAMNMAKKAKLKASQQEVEAAKSQ